MSGDDNFTSGEISDLLRLEEGLSGWEVEFLESVWKWILAGGTPSDKQTAKVHQIWDRLCG